jgi:hypothetical protein
MAYGFTFYKANTSDFDTAIRNINAANPTKAASIVVARYADGLNALAGRAQVLEAFANTSTAPIIPTEGEIRMWMLSGLGYKSQDFIAYYNNLYNNPSYAAKIIADRLFEDNILVPFTVTQAANQNGNPSQPLVYGDTAFLLAISSGTNVYDVGYPALTATSNNIVAGSTFSKILGTLYYNGTNSYTIVNPGAYYTSRFAIPASTNWTAETWINPDRYGGGILGAPSTDNNNYWSLNLTSDGKVRFNAFAITLTATTVLPLRTWHHVAVTLYSNTLRLFVNGNLEATTPINPKIFFGGDQAGNFWIGLFQGSYFQGGIAATRHVIGKAAYITNFTPSTSKPKASRAAVLNAYASNLNADLIPDQYSQEYWMTTGFDSFPTPIYSSTDITWNQVDSFYMPAYGYASNIYSFCAGKEIKVNQILITSADITSAYLSNIITVDNSTGRVIITGGNTDAYITVLMR